MTDAPKLKPCPFCGGDAEVTDTTKVLGVWRLIHRCKAIGPISLERYNEETLTNAWNTRADLSADLVRAALEAAAAPIYKWSIAAAEEIEALSADPETIAAIVARVTEAGQ